MAKAVKKSRVKILVPNRMRSPMFLSHMSKKTIREVEDLMTVLSLPRWRITEALIQRGLYSVMDTEFKGDIPGLDKAIKNLKLEWEEGQNDGLFN